MKRTLLLLFAVLVFSGVSGCLREQVACDPCDSCVQPCARSACCWPPCDACCGHRVRDPGRCPRRALDAPQPPVAAVTYPYYTLRGPRDFLQRQPSPIGP